MAKAGSPFYLTIPSDDSFPSNRLSNFRVKHPGIHLEGEWQVALVEMIYPVSHYNLSGCHIEMTTFEPNRTLLPDMKSSAVLTLASRHYSSINEVINSLKAGYAKYWASRRAEIKELEVTKENAAAVDSELALIEAARGGVIFAYRPIDTRVKITIIGSGVDQLSINEKLNYALGFRSHTPLALGQHVADYPPDFNVGTENMFIYTDIIDPQMVGPVMTPLLKIIPIRGVFGDQQVAEFRHMHYVDVLSRDFDTIQFSIKDQTGKDIEFTSGQVIVKLHFRRKTMLM